MTAPVSLHSARADASHMSPSNIAAQNQRWPGRIRHVSAAGAFIETVARPQLGNETALIHPEIGAIVAAVSGHSRDGISLTFTVTEESAAFALAVTAHEMTVAPDRSTAT